MPFYKNWGFALVVIWFVTFFVNWAVHGGDPVSLIFLELAATLAWLVAWTGWSAFVRSRRPLDAQAEHPDQMPVHLWIVTGLAVIWYGMATASYVARHTGGDIAPGHPAAPPYPAWVDVAWALGVWGGLIASLLLPVRARYAVAGFAVSVAGLLVEAVHARPFWLSTGAPGFLVFQGVIVALLLLFYAWRMQRREATRLPMTPVA
jgi:hypothetical protein